MVESVTYTESYTSLYALFAQGGEVLPVWSVTVCVKSFASSCSPVAHTAEPLPRISARGHLPINKIIFGRPKYLDLPKPKNVLSVAI